MHRTPAHRKRHSRPSRTDALFHVVIGIGISGGLAYIPPFFSALERALEPVYAHAESMLAIVVFGAVAAVPPFVPPTLPTDRKEAPRSDLQPLIHPRVTSVSVW